MYLMAGGTGDKEFHSTRAKVYSNQEDAMRVLLSVADAVGDLLADQVNHGGADAVQMFDTWAGLLSESDYRKYAKPATERAIEVFRNKANRRVPLIHYAKGSSHLHHEIRSLDIDAVSLDWRDDLKANRTEFGSEFAFQGNLDPSRMHGSPKAAQEAAEHVLRNAGNEPGHIFNLGHGFSPGAQIDCVKQCCVQSQVSEMREKMVKMVYALQDAICEAIKTIDHSEYREDEWTREEGGGGRSRVFSEGDVFEKAGVNVSVVYGTLSPEAAEKMGGGHQLEGSDLDFFATGISLVLHPNNPMAPTVHANYRYFERGAGEVEGSWWFGGGADLTPSYLFEEDAIHFHRVHKEACDRHEVADYNRFKEWCDTYFHIPHRNEGRGVGGIFFDDIRAASKQECLNLFKTVATSS